MKILDNMAEGMLNLYTSENSLSFRWTSFVSRL